MRKITDYIDMAKERSGVKSDRKLCAMLGMSDMWVHQVKKHRALPSDDTMLKLAEIAGIPPHEALLDLNILRSTGKAQAVYKKLSAAAEKAVKVNILPALLTVIIVSNEMVDFIYYGK